MLFAFGLKNMVRLPARAYVTNPAEDENANSSIKDRWRPGKDNTGKTIPALSQGTVIFRLPMVIFMPRIGIIHRMKPLCPVIISDSGT